MKLENKIVFITGATKGIGFELAKQLSQKSNIVIIGGRNQDLLKEIEKDHPSLKTIYFDALNDKVIINVKDELQNEFGRIDVLINNAAICHSYNFYESNISFEEIDIEITTNISSPIKLTKYLLPLLNSDNETAIVNITSGIAYLPMPNLPVYSATKAALQSFTISLRESLRTTKINVFEALPPLVATQMTENLIGNGKKMKRMTSIDCADAIIKGIEKNTLTIKIGSSKSLYWGSKFFPSIVQKQLNKM
jgi:uncharacterized oxidoreductase